MGSAWARGLTGLVDSGVIAEFQHVEVSPFHTAPDAVDPRDVRALVVHPVQRPHEVIVAVVTEGDGGDELEEQEEMEEDCEAVRHLARRPQGQHGACLPQWSELKGPRSSSAL